MNDRPEVPQHDDEGELSVVERPKSKRPRRYQVVLHNDDYTSMEFVVAVIVKFFRKSTAEATHIMLHIHHRGYAAVDAFPRDVAETKAQQVMDYAKQHQFPLKSTAEPEDHQLGD